MAIDPRKLYGQGKGGIFSKVQPDPINLPPGFDWWKANPLPQGGTYTDPAWNPPPQEPDPNGGASGGAKQHITPSGTATAAELYDALVAKLGQSDLRNQIGTDWLTQYKDKLINSIIPAAQSAYTTAGIQNALNNYWKKAILMAYSAATGNPYYDKTGDGSMANLLFIPGFKPNAPGQVASDQAQYIT